MYHIRAKQLVFNYIETQEPPTFEVFIVWFSKTLQNWKALVASTLPDQKYYEVTYDGDARQTYIDEYEKVKNVVIRDALTPM